MSTKNFSNIILCLLLIAFFQITDINTAFSQKKWQNISTIEDVCKAYPEQMESIFHNLNLNYPGLELVKKVYESNDIPKACKELLSYYNSTNRIDHQLPAISQKITTDADSILHDIFTFQLVPAQVPRLPDGRLNWDYKGPDNDMEWAWALNRNYPTQFLFLDWKETGNSEYLKYIDQFTKDWIISSWPYPAKRSNTAMWRGLEVSFRAKMWAKVFYDLWDTHLISPATQLLILSSLPDHADYARNYHSQGNWLTMEISGLATIASYWPEYKQSPVWMKYAIETMVASMKKQVYPDGVQTELTSHYHHVALSNFSLFADLCQKSNVSLPVYYTNMLEDMTGYLSETMRPDGFGLLNNDADLDNNREFILKAAKKYNRSDWEYIASNGRLGEKPEKEPSYIFPYGGQMISRSGFDKNAQWSFFDIGPWGSGHQHNDKLHISVSAYDRDFLVDGGRFAYQGETARKFRNYATGSQSHNVILIDGKGQAPGPRMVNEPLLGSQYKIDRNFDFATGSIDNFSNLEGKCKHTRTLLYVRGNFWVVVDNISTNMPRKIETLWHWHPDCMVKKETDGITASENKKGNLEIIPVNYKKWDVNLVKGQEFPEIQGWYSKQYNTYEPNITAVYSTKIKSDKTFVWVLFPSEKSLPNINAKIISKSKDKLIVQVNNPEKGKWKIIIPFYDSTKASVNYSK